jgi:hypothetical protein
MDATVRLPAAGLQLVSGDGSAVGRAGSVRIVLPAMNLAGGTCRLATAPALLCLGTCAAVWVENTPVEPLIVQSRPAVHTGMHKPAGLDAAQGIKCRKEMAAV